MQHKKIIICLLSAVLAATAAGMSGCDQVRNAADIAKNTVVSLADKVTNFEMDQEAEALNTVLHNFCSGILDGSINSLSHGNTITAPLPSPDADSTERSAALQQLTVLSALEGQGMTSRYPEDKIADFVSCNGTIKYSASIDAREETGIPLHYTTTIAEALNKA